MTEKIAKKIGSKLAIKSIVIGLVSAQLFMMLLGYDSSFLKAFFWFLQSPDLYFITHVLFGIIFLFVASHFFGQKAGYEILIEKQEPGATGFKYALFTLIAATFFGSLIAFFEEGIYNIGTDDDPFYDYIFKPMFWVILIGILPVLLIGFWFGRKIKKEGARNLHSL